MDVLVDIVGRLPTPATKILDVLEIFFDVKTSIWTLTETLVIFDCFHMAGTTPFAIDELKMAQRGSHSAKAKSRKNQFGKQSGPGALCMLIRSSFRKTSSGLIV
jgi:hypothetical protein